MNSQSEIALIRQRIDQEVSALARLKHGFASVASHEMISRRYAFLEDCFSALAPHTGEQAAIELIAQQLDRALEGERHGRG